MTRACGLVGLACLGTYSDWNKHLRNPEGAVETPLRALVFAVTEKGDLCHCELRPTTVASTT